MSISHQLRKEPEALTQETISYAAIRRHFARDYGSHQHQQLERGQKVLQTEQEMNQYLYSYAPMTKRQWTRIFDEMSLPPASFSVIDYAAGQGLATIHLLDRLGCNRKRLHRCTLTDISRPALRRAWEILSIYGETLEIKSLERDLDKIEAADLYSGDSEKSFVHLFSNIIDMDAFDLPTLFSKVLDKNGHHQLVAISPWRDFDGGDARFREMAGWLAEAHQSGKIKLVDEVKKQIIRDERGEKHSLCVARCEVMNGSL